MPKLNILVALAAAWGCLAVAAPGEDCRPEFNARTGLPERTVADRLAADLQSTDDDIVRSTLQRLIYLPVGHLSEPSEAVGRRLLELAATSPAFSEYAALAFLRLTKPTEWAGVATLLDLSLLGQEQRSAFYDDVRSALITYRLPDTFPLPKPPGS